MWVAEWLKSKDLWKCYRYLRNLSNYNPMLSFSPKMNFFFSTRTNLKNRDWTFLAMSFFTWKICQKMIAKILEWFLYCSITHRIKSSVCWEFTEGSSYCGRFKFKAALATKKNKKWLYVSTTFVIRSRIKSFLISVILLKLYVFPTRFVLINLLMINSCYSNLY